MHATNGCLSIKYDKSKILVLNNSKVENYASHSELMKNKESMYYKLFNEQAKNYQV